MARKEIKVKRIDITDWRQALIGGTLLGMVLCTAPAMITGLMMLGGILLTIKLVGMGRL